MLRTLEDCCQNSREKCDFYATNNTDICALEVAEVSDLIWLSRLNYYNLYAKCEDNGLSYQTMRKLAIDSMPKKVKKIMQEKLKKSKINPLSITPQNGFIFFQILSKTFSFNKHSDLDLQ